MPRSAKDSARSVLFLSCDMVGSTRFKQSTEPWQGVFLNFYREFPRILGAVSAKQNEIDGFTTEYELWKAIGDELIFQVTVTSEQQIGRAVRIWLSALDQYEREVLSDGQMGLKGSAFIASFPGPDSESTIPRKLDTETSGSTVFARNQEALKGNRSHTKYQFDYFGPSIDTGFRIAALASHRYFTMTVEVAWAVSAGATHAAQEQLGRDVHHVNDVVFRGTHQLKGVWNGREYPVFAIDREFDEPVYEALRELEGPRLTADHISAVCHACAKDASWPFHIYLPDSGLAQFQQVPEDAMERARASDETMAGIESEVSGEGRDLESTPPLGDTTPTITPASEDAPE